MTAGEDHTFPEDRVRMTLSDPDFYNSRLFGRRISDKQRMSVAEKSQMFEDHIRENTDAQEKTIPLRQRLRKIKQRIKASETTEKSQGRTKYFANPVSTYQPSASRGEQQEEAENFVVPQPLPGEDYLDYSIRIKNEFDYFLAVNGLDIREIEYQSVLKKTLDIMKRSTLMAGRSSQQLNRIGCNIDSLETFFTALIDLDAKGKPDRVFRKIDSMVFDIETDYVETFLTKLHLLLRYVTGEDNARSMIISSFKKTLRMVPDVARFVENRYLHREEGLLEIARSVQSYIDDRPEKPDRRRINAILSNDNEERPENLRPVIALAHQRKPRWWKDKHGQIIIKIGKRKTSLSG